MSQSKAIDKWCNHDNYEYFYNKAPTKNILQNYSTRGGLKSGCDIASFYSKLKTVNSLLEVGAGYGRVLNFLLQNGFTGAIDAIEKSDAFFEELQQYSDKVTLHHLDILAFSDKQFDAVLSMWSGISDFSQTEQPIYLAKLAELLHDSGTIYLDTSIYDQKPLNAEVSIGQAYIVSEGDYITRGYIPSFDEIQSYCLQAGLKIVENYIYQTDVKRDRMIYVLEKG